MILLKKFCFSPYSVYETHDKALHLLIIQKKIDQFSAELRKLSVDIARKNAHNMSMSILSMGMTNDYEVAIEEGATMVRVGTAIFGAVIMLKQT